MLQERHVLLPKVLYWFWLPGDVHNTSVSLVSKSGKSMRHTTPVFPGFQEWKIGEAPVFPGFQEAKCQNGLAANLLTLGLYLQYSNFCEGCPVFGWSKCFRATIRLLGAL